MPDRCPRCGSPALVERTWGVVCGACGATVTRNPRRWRWSWDRFCAGAGAWVAVALILATGLRLR